MLYVKVFFTVVSLSYFINLKSQLSNSAKKNHFIGNSI